MGDVRVGVMGSAPMGHWTMTRIDTSCRYVVHKAEWGFSSSVDHMDVITPVNRIISTLLFKALAPAQDRLALEKDCHASRERFVAVVQL